MKGGAERLSLASDRDSIYKNLPDTKAVSLLRGRKDGETQPSERCSGPAHGNPCLEPSWFPSWFLPFMAAPLGSLLATGLLVGPSAGEYAKQPKNGIFVFALGSGDMLMRLEGCSSFLFEPVSRQAGSGGASASPRMAEGQSIAFPAPWGEEMAAASCLWRWGVFLTYRDRFFYWSGFRGVVKPDS